MSLEGAERHGVAFRRLLHVDQARVPRRNLRALKPLAGGPCAGVVCETALVETLESGQIGAAGSDVFEEEPPAQASALLALGLTAECSGRMAVGAIGNTIDYLNGRIDPALVVNAGTLHEC